MKVKGILIAALLGIVSFSTSSAITSSRQTPVVTELVNTVSQRKTRSFPFQITRLSNPTIVFLPADFEWSVLDLTIRQHTQLKVLGSKRVPCIVRFLNTPLIPSSPEEESPLAARAKSPAAEDQPSF